MTRNLLRAGALSCALLTSTAMCTQPALAQTAREHRALDGNGVDMTHGDFVMAVPEGSIGSGEGELALVRTGVWWAGGFNVNGHQWDDIQFTKIPLFGGGVRYSVVIGKRFENFDGTGTLPTGSSLTGSGGSFVYRTADGTAIEFGNQGYGHYGPEPNFCNGDAGQGQCSLIPTAIGAPDGKTVYLNWTVYSYCYGDATAESLPCNYRPRLADVSNSHGYQIQFAHATDDPGFTIEPPAGWFQRTGATFHNTTVSGNPAQGSVSYAYPATGVTEVTDMAGRVWRFSGTLDRPTGIRRPGASADTTTIAYTSGLVSSVTNEGVTTSYARSLSGTTLTATATDPASGVTTVVSDMDIGRPTSVTDPLSRTTSYQYDSDRRLTRVTAPEGNYVQYAYDARGNVTQTSAVPKSGSGLATITTSASFPSSCTDPLTCNSPTSTTDARGSVTNYTYDTTHGGVTAVTGPAPSGSGDRPEVRYTYALTNGEYRVTEVSACASGNASNCVGTANESRAVIGYDANGNVTSMQARDGTGALSATNSMTYTPLGDVASVDGPLSGTADTTHMRYNAARQMVGAVSPDPDGGGSLTHRAVRTSYGTTTGLPIKQELGTVAGTSDTAWAAFSASQASEVEYDANARPVVQRLTSGSTTYALTQASYDSLGRPRCTAQRMNPSEFATSSLPSDACTLDTEGTFGPDRIQRTSYDAASQVTKVESGVGVSGVAADEVTASYRNNSQVETLTDGEGNRTTYVYDGHDRLSRTRFPSTTQGAGSSSTTDYEELGYDAASNVTSLRLRDGNSVAMTYDALNRPTFRNLPGSEPDVTMTYDLLGRLAGASQSGHALTFTHDALGRLLTETGPLGTMASQYDAAGRRTRLTQPDSNYTTFDHLVTGEVSAVRENGASSGVGVLASYTYDNLGRRTGMTRGNGSALTTSFDAVSRLSGMSDDLASSGYDQSVTFSHNPAGQIVGVTRSNDSYAFTGLANQNLTDSHNGLNQVTANGGTSVSHDARGNTTAIGSASYGYDSQNRMTSGPGSTSLTYDPLGRLYETSDGSTTTRFQYDGVEIAGEYDGSSTRQRRYARGPGMDEPLVWYEGSGITDRRFLHADERGSITARSDGLGAGAAVNRYDDYGNPQGGSITGRFGYTGQAWLPGLNLWYYKTRMFNGSRFMQSDLIGYGDGMNRYAAMRGDPVNLSDPFGMKANCTDVELRSWHVWINGKYDGPQDMEVHTRYTYCLDGGMGPSHFGGGGASGGAGGASSPATDHCPPWHGQRTPSDLTGRNTEDYEAIFAPFSAIAANRLRREAINATEKRFGLNSTNNQGDAYRHFYWSFAVTREIGADLAELFGTGHEVSVPNRPGETYMDLYNNAVGRALAQDSRYANSTPAQAAERALNAGCLIISP